MISGGILGAVFEQADPNDDEAYLDELDDFIDNFGDRLVFCGDEPSQATISIEDVYVHALEIADANGTLSDRNFLLQRLGTIRAGVFDCDFTTDL